MTKKISFLLAIIMAFCSCIALSSCDEPTEDDDEKYPTTYFFDYRISDDRTYCSVTSYGATTETVSTIPEEYEGIPVTEIAAEAFARDYGKNYIVEMTLASSIKKINTSAFYECTNLKTINFKEGLVHICHGAFAKCTSLTGVKLPEGLEIIDDFAFRECTNLKSVTLPSTLKSMGANVFAGTKYLLESAPIHNGNITHIPNVAGKTWVVYADFTVTDANLPDNAVGIASEAFAYCDAMTTIEIPAGVKYISKNAFIGCTALTTVNYGGSPEDFAKLVIEDGNDALLNAMINFGK